MKSEIQQIVYLQWPGLFFRKLEWLLLYTHYADLVTPPLNSLLWPCIPLPVEYTYSISPYYLGNITAQERDNNICPDNDCNFVYH